jgi:hypothetical protein
MLLQVKDVTGDHHIKLSTPGLEGQRSHVFPHMWRLDLKDKGIHKYIHDHIYTHVHIAYTCIYMCVWRKRVFYYSR